MACGDGRGAGPIGALPCSAPGVIFRRMPPKLVPCAMVDLLNAAMKALRTNQTPGIFHQITAEWLGERNWKITLASNSINGDVITDFIPALSTATTSSPTTFQERLIEPGKNLVHFEKYSWNPIRGNGGIQIELLCTTKPYVGIDETTGKGYWEV